MHHAARLRVVAHIDLDAFYCQVEVSRNPELRGQPVAVIQYNPWDKEALKTALRPEDNRIFNDSNGSIIAVSYEARRFGVKRNMSGQQSRQLCPSLQLVQVPTAHGKADLSIYRQAGQQVAAILARGSVLERASVDEAYLDLTEAANRVLAALDNDDAAAAAAAAASPAASGGGGGREVLATGLTAAVAAAGCRPGLPPPPPSLSDWQVKGLEEEEEEEDPLEASAAASAAEGGSDDDDEEEVAGHAAERYGSDVEGAVADANAPYSTAPACTADARASTSSAAPTVSMMMSAPAPPLPGVAAMTLDSSAATVPAVYGTAADTEGGGAPSPTAPTATAAAAATTTTTAATPPRRPPAAAASTVNTTTPTAVTYTAATRTTPTDAGAAAGASPGGAEDEQQRRRRQRLRSYWLRPAADWDPYERLLFAGAVVVLQLRAAVLRELGFTCSAGVAHYKLLAKLGSGLHKPNQQTVILGRAVPVLLRDLPLSKLRSLGGKFGEQVQEQLGIKTVGELWSVPLPRLESLFGQEAAAGLVRLAAGMDDEEVRPRLAPKSLGCGKTFRGSSALTDMAQVFHWLLQLATELAERIEADRCQHERLPSLLTVSMQAPTQRVLPAGPGTGAMGAAAGGEVGGGSNHSRSGRLPRVTVEAIAEEAVALMKKWAAERSSWRITSLAITASRFGAAPTGSSTITRFLQRSPHKQPSQPARAQPPPAAAREPPPLEAPSTSQAQDRLLQYGDEPPPSPPPPPPPPQQRQELLEGGQRQQQQQQQSEQQRWQRQAPGWRQPEQHKTGRPAGSHSEGALTAAAVAVEQAGEYGSLLEGSVRPAADGAAAAVSSAITATAGRGPGDGRSWQPSTSPSGTAQSRQGGVVGGLGRDGGAGAGQRRQQQRQQSRDVRALLLRGAQQGRARTTSVPLPPQPSYGGQGPTDGDAGTATAVEPPVVATVTCHPTTQPVLTEVAAAALPPLPPSPPQPRAPPPKVKPSAEPPVSTPQPSITAAPTSSASASYMGPAAGSIAAAVSSVRTLKREQQQRQPLAPAPEAAGATPTPRPLVPYTRESLAALLLRRQPRRAVCGLDASPPQSNPKPSAAVVAFNGAAVSSGDPLPSPLSPSQPAASAPNRPHNRPPQPLPRAQARPCPVHLPLLNPQSHPHQSHPHQSRSHLPTGEGRPSYAPEVVVIDSDDDEVAAASPSRSRSPPLLWGPPRLLVHGRQVGLPLETEVSAGLTAGAAAHLAGVDGEGDFQDYSVGAVAAVAAEVLTERQAAAEGQESGGDWDVCEDCGGGSRGSPVPPVSSLQDWLQQQQTQAPSQQPHQEQELSGPHYPHPHLHPQPDVQWRLHQQQQRPQHQLPQEPRPAPQHSGDDRHPSRQPGPVQQHDSRKPLYGQGNVDERGASPPPPSPSRQPALESFAAPPLATVPTVSADSTGPAARQVPPGTAATTTTITATATATAATATAATTTAAGGAASGEWAAAWGGGPAAAAVPVPARKDSGGGRGGVSSGGGGAGGSDWLQQPLQVDEGVLEELPWEIREEVRRSIWAAQGRQGSSEAGRPHQSLHQQRQPTRQPQQEHRHHTARQGPSSSYSRGRMGGKRRRDSQQQQQADIRRFSKPTK